MPNGIGDIWKVQSASILANQLAINTLHYIVTDVVGVGISSVQVASAFDALQAAAMKGMMAANATYRGVGAQKVFPEVEAFGSWVGSTGPGTFASGTGALPTQVCGLVTLRTNRSGRTGRGRVYLPFPDAAGNSATLDSPNAAYVAAVATWLTAVQGPLTLTVGGNSLVFSLIVLNKVLPGGSPQVTAFVTQAKWATQRRRGPYGRLNSLPW